MVGAPIEALGIGVDDFTEPRTVVQIGLPLRRIDRMTRITGVQFSNAWESRIEVAVADIEIPISGRDCLLANKRAPGQPHDIADVCALL